MYRENEKVPIDKGRIEKKREKEMGGDGKRRNKEKTRTALRL